MKKIEDKYLKICNNVYYKYYRKCFADKEDIIFSGYINILEHKNDFISLPEEEQTKKLYNLAQLGMRKYLNSVRLSIISEKVVTVTLDKEDLNFTELVEDNNTPDSNINYNCLVFYINKFCNSYDKDRLQVFKMYFNKKTLDYIKRTLNISYITIKEYITTFRIDLYDYLVFNELIPRYKYDFNNIELSVNTIRSNRFDMFKRAKKSGTFDLSMYKNDYLIYKLIRKDKDLIKYATALNISIEDLEKVIFHKVNCSKLKLYQVQKLRQLYFPTYSLNDLVSEVLECC